MVVTLLTGLLLGTGIGAGVGGLSGVQNVAFNKLLPVLPLPESTLNAARFRGLIDQGKYQEDLAAAGQSAENAEISFNAARALNDTQELVTLFFRSALGGTPEENLAEFHRLAGQLGLSPEVADRTRAAALQIGTPSDLVRFLVREVFSPELRERLELDRDYPPEADAEFRRLGVAPSYARNIWAAHWQLPAVGQLRTAFLRYSPETREHWEDEVRSMGLTPDSVETNQADMLDLLKFSDVGTYYRERILSTLYSDLGQIQLRWLVRFRFLNFEQTTYRLMRQGLPKPLARTVAQVFFCVQSSTDWKNAVKAGVMDWQDILAEMAQWEIQSEQVVRIVQLKVAPDTLSMVEPERNVAKATVLDAYDLGIDDEERTKARLVDLGYSRDQAAFILDVHDQERRVKELRETERAGLTKTEIKRALRAGTISPAYAIQELERRGVDPEAARIIADTERPEPDA